jgi:hypothetical protein
MVSNVKTAQDYRQLARALRAAADRMNESEQAGAARSMADHYDQLAKDLDSAEANALKGAKPPN